MEMQVKKSGSWLGKIIMAGIIIAVIIFVVNKNGNKPVSEEQIKIDIQTEDSAFGQYIMEIENVTITERKTAEDGSFDMICLMVTASNEDLTYTANYDITYGKYQDGWQLDGFQVLEYEYISKVDCPMDVVENAIHKEVDEHGQVIAIDLMEREGDKQYQTVTCSFSLIRENNEVQNFIAKVKCSCLFTGCWGGTATIYHADTGKPAYLGWLFE